MYKRQVPARIRNRTGHWCAACTLPEEFLSRVGLRIQERLAKAQDSRDATIHPSVAIVQPQGVALPGGGCSFLDLPQIPGWTSQLCLHKLDDFHVCPSRPSSPLTIDCTPLISQNRPSQGWRALFPITLFLSLSSLLSHYRTPQKMLSLFVLKCVLGNLKCTLVGR